MSPAPDAHSALITARRERSRAWRVIHALGSLKLALILLATIALAIAVATFCESSFNTKIAQAYIYKAPWFTVWLGVLCVNLFAVTLTRWPWRRKHLGFVITHYGIITLLIGAIIGSKLGFEGNVTLRKGASPLDRITTSHSMVQIENPGTGGFVLERFDPALTMPSERRPDMFAVPGTDWKIVVDAFGENLVEQESLAASSAPGAVPGATLALDTAMMDQHLSLPLLLGSERDFFGLATIKFLPRLPGHAPSIARETQMVFARFAPVVQRENGTTGVTAQLSADGETLTISAPGSPPQKHRLGDIADRVLHAGSASIEIGGYWPDFKIVNGEPASASGQPNNPAVLVRIAGPAQANAEGKARPLLELAPDGAGLQYQLSRGEQIAASGPAKIGEPFALGWADWKATITDLLPKAEITTALEPAPQGKATGIAGFRARIRAPDGREGRGEWIRAGTLTPLALDGKSLRVGYGLELREIPFTIGLRNFEVPRVEGADTPANFIATVEFRDKATGAAREGVAQMNHPASWPGTAFAVVTGLNYKFSQASWNPGDLDETTLQVLYDPGWLFKWVGSLAICAGIFIMFYLRPKKP